MEVARDPVRHIQGASGQMKDTQRTNCPMTDPPTADPDEQVKAIPFSFEDRDLILALYTLEPETETHFKLAVVKGPGIIVRLNAYDLDQLLGEIAAVANHEENARRAKKLDNLFDRVSEKFEKYFPR